MEDELTKKKKRITQATQLAYFLFNLQVGTENEMIDKKLIGI